jgi:hypothetical protein
MLRTPRAAAAKRKSLPRKLRATVMRAIYGDIHDPEHGHEEVYVLSTGP